MPPHGCSVGPCEVDHPVVEVAGVAFAVGVAVGLGDVDLERAVVAGVAVSVVVGVGLVVDDSWAVVFRVEDAVVVVVGVAGIA